MVTSIFPPFLTPRTAASARILPTSIPSPAFLLLVLLLIVVILIDIVVFVVVLLLIRHSVWLALGSGFVTLILVFPSTMRTSASPPLGSDLDCPSGGYGRFRRNDWLKTSV